MNLRNQGGRIILCVIASILLIPGILPTFAANTDPARPNVLFVLADDLGYGDVKAFGDAMGTTSIVPTPCMDSLAKEGMMFMQMHSCSALCSPSRYGILTGRYSWRLKADGVLPGGVVGGYGRPIIRQGELTIAQFLKNQGYDTAGFGKWHLGTQFYDRQGHPFQGNHTRVTSSAQINLSRHLEGHALDQGFNHFFGAVGALNGNPFAYVVDDHIYFEGKPATADTPWMLKPADSFAPGSHGGDSLADPTLTQARFSPDMIAHATSYLESRAANAQPFFAYVALYSPHLPHIPSKDFIGSSGKTNFAYGDYVHETDYWIGRLVDALGASASNTIVIVTSDNGPEGVAYAQGLRRGHDSNGPFKGVKRDSWEGGHRIPFIIRWPGKIAAGTRSDALFWLGDFYATIADYLKTAIPAKQAPDSESFLSTLLNKPAPRPKPLILASGQNQLSISTTDGWKLIDGTGDGGANVSYDADNQKILNAHGKIGGNPKQLFYLHDDIGERKDVQAANPDKVKELMQELDSYQDTKKSRAGTIPVNEEAE